jgi:DNA repair protein SbcC/Rad50
LTLNIAQLREHLAHTFSDVEQVEPSVVRFTRKGATEPFAVYYVDIDSDLPDTPDALTRYQDRVIGKRYFEGRQSLQWSTYLYFVVSDEQARGPAVQTARVLIELDRTYARKFVIPESELDAALQVSPPESSDALPEPNILSIWLAKLAEAGLDKAVVSDEPLPSRLSLIETSSGEPSVQPKAMISRPASRPMPFLTSIELTKFRAFPVQRQFDLGTVTLIVGANGSGKTSLLEAIELLYCGRNKRNADAVDPYTIAAKFADGSKEIATRGRLPKTFRKRNLAWYGQAEIKTNNLCFSFGLYNFLDTDAAVRLAESTRALEEDLSRLLVGSEASKTWRQIERVYEATTAKLYDLRPLEAQIKSEIAALDGRLKESRSVKQESDSVFVRLEDMLGRLAWIMSAKDKGAVAEELLTSLPELMALAQQASTLTWIESPATMNRLKRYSNDAAKLSDKAGADIARFEEIRNKERRVVDASRRCQSALELIISDSRCGCRPALTRTRDRQATERRCISRRLAGRMR